MVKAAMERPEQDQNSRQKPATAVLIPQAARRAAVFGTPMPWPRGSAGWRPAAGGALPGGALPGTLRDVPQSQRLLVALQSTGARVSLWGQGTT